MSPDADMWLGRVTALATTTTPLQVERNGHPGATSAEPLSDFAGATAGATEVLGVTIAGRRFVWRVL